MSYVYPGLSWLLADLIGASRAKEVLFNGAVVGGQEARTSATRTALGNASAADLFAGFRRRGR